METDGCSEISHFQKPPAKCDVWRQTGALRYRTSTAAEGAPGSGRWAGRVGDGEPACTRDPVARLGELVTIHLRGLPEGAPKGERAVRALCSALLRVGFASRPGHPGRWCALTAPFHPCLWPGHPGPSADSLCCTDPSGRPDLALASTLPCGVPTFLDTHVRAAATRPTHRRGPVYGWSRELRLRRRRGTRTRAS